jgi:hypothetical protein
LVDWKQIFVVISGPVKIMTNVAQKLMISAIFSLLIIAESEVYIVTIEGDPVISYRGDIDGFEATSVDSDSDQKLDVTRLVVFLNDLMINDIPVVFFVTILLCAQ